MRRCSLDERGVTLLELSVAVGISMLLLLPTLNLMRSTDRSIYDLNGKYNRAEFKSILLGRITNSNLCNKTINSATNSILFNPVPASTSRGQYLNIDLGDNLNLTSSDTAAEITRYNIGYENVTLRNTVRVGPDLSAPSNTLYKGELAMKVDRFVISDDKRKLVMMPYESLGTLIVSVTQQNHFANCEFVEPTHSVCQDFNGVVEVGATPNCKLQSPCPNGLVYSGNDASGAAICVTATTGCKFEQTMVADGHGGYKCRSVSFGYQSLPTALADVVGN